MSSNIINLTFFLSEITSKILNKVNDKFKRKESIINLPL